MEDLLGTPFSPAEPVDKGAARTCGYASVRALALFEQHGSSKAVSRAILKELIASYEKRPLPSGMDELQAARLRPEEWAEELIAELQRSAYWPPQVRDK